jgi:insertion element IS1 protein InsB
MWLWYFLDQTTKKIVEYVFDLRTDETFKKLLKLVEHLPISHLFTDDWQAYKWCLSNVRYTVSKKFTQNIERMNLNLRIHIKRLSRKIICFSKSQIIHDKLVGTYIQNNYFN